MHLIDDCFLHWPFERLIVFPVIAGCVDDNRSHGCCQVILRAPGIRAVPDTLGVAHGIGIDENLVPVKPVARFDAGWPVNAEAIMSAGWQSFYKNMPEVKGLVDRSEERRVGKECSV